MIEPGADGLRKGLWVEDTGGETDEIGFRGRLKNRLERVFSKKKPEKLELVVGEQPHVTWLLNKLNAATTLLEGRQALITYRNFHGSTFATPRFSDEDGKPKQYEVRELLTVLQALIDGEAILSAQIPRPIRDLCSRLASGSQPVERRQSGNYVECIDQNNKKVRIPEAVVLKIQSQKVHQLSKGSRILYDESYGTSLLSPERRAIDEPSIAEAVEVGGYHWITPTPVGRDRFPVVIRVKPSEYQQLMSKLQHLK